jgi:hypothetical protein
MTGRVPKKLQAFHTEMSTKHFTFDSHYLPDFAVVEERGGNISRFPHTDQLPKLYRALNLEFYRGLPQRLSRLDHRAEDYRKIQLHCLVLMFCSYFNRERKDSIRLHPAIGQDKVARISIVQQTVEHHEQGPLHRFKIYAGEDCNTEIYLNGHRIVFAGHALERFSERAPNPLGSDLTNVLVAFFGAPAVLMLCNENPAFTFRYANTVIAFPVRHSDSEPEYFLPTCLAAEQISKLEPIHPPVAYTFHYQQADKTGEFRNWSVIERQAALYHLWKRKELLKVDKSPEVEEMSWYEMAHRLTDENEFGPGSRLLFMDNIHGPNTISLQPNENETKHDVVEDLKKMEPNRDWDAIYREQKAANRKWHAD